MLRHYQFLHDRNPDMHNSPEVLHVVDYLRGNGTRVPNEPTEKIGAYVTFLADSDYVNDGIITGDKASIIRQVESNIIKPEEVPESYFDLQRRIARERGEGDINITPTMRERMIEAIRADQGVSLGQWVEYLGGNDGGYPDWFKHYTWNSVLKMGSFNKGKGEFQRRSKTTTAPYPEMNREALALTYDAVNKRINFSDSEEENIDELQKLAISGSFSKLYGHALLKTVSKSKEVNEGVDGSWRMYNETTDPRIARRLSESLQGHGTGWCTAGESIAAEQLSAGDFYVYYTQDQEGKDTIPRIAIRMEGNRVAEVRGILPDQSLEPAMAEIVAEKLTNLPGGEEYLAKSEDMIRVKNIEKKTNQGLDLDLEELSFIYEFGHRIKGFGYREFDPRVGEIIAKRDAVVDIKRITGFKDLEKKAAHKMIDRGQVFGLIRHTKYFKDLDISVLERILDSDEIAEYVPGQYNYQGLHNLFEYSNDELATKYVLENIKNFKIANGEIGIQIARKMAPLFESSKDVNSQTVTDFLAKFDGEAVAYLLSETESWEFADLLNEGDLSGSDLPFSFALFLLSAGEDDIVRKNLDSFNLQARLQIAKYFDPDGQYDDDYFEFSDDDPSWHVNT